MTDAGWAPNSEVESAIDELKAQVQKIYNAGYQQGRVAGLREACIAVSQFSSDGVPINADELRIALVQLLGSLAQQAQEGGVGDAEN